MKPATPGKRRPRAASEKSGDPPGTVVLFNKPHGVHCQFSADGSGKATLKDFVPVPGIYPAGRLDADSEGLVILTADGALQARIAHPRHKLDKTYWVEVEGIPDAATLGILERGIDLGDFVTRPACVRAISPPDVWPRVPPIRVRKAIPTSWLAITLTEGKNRQVRRMTAAAGFPTLRLIRWAIGPWTLDGLASGAWRRERAPSHML